MIQALRNTIPFRRFSGVKIGKLVRVDLVSGRDSLGYGSSIDDFSRLSSSAGGSLNIGERCEIGVGVQILTYGGEILIGSDCSFNPYCVIYGHGGLKIGNSVRVAAHTVIIPSNHEFHSLDMPIRLQGLSAKGITIDDDVWIGAGVRILDGVAIGKGSVVAAGSVVTRDVPEYSVVAGVPAKILKWRKQVPVSRNDALEA